MPDRRPFTITKFEQHPDGYYTARVTSGDETLTVDNQYGSWLGHRRLAPRSRTFVLCDLRRDVAAALQAKVPRRARTKVAA